MKETNAFSKVVSQINKNSNLGLTPNVKKTILWFILAFASLLISLEVIVAALNAFSGKSPIKDIGFTITDGILFFFIIFIFCVAYTLYSLFNSKKMARDAYEINFINPSDFKNDEEEGLYNLVKSASEKANLTKVPSVGVYDSAEMNAFATGPNRDDSIVVFSSSLLTSMDEKEVAAVACHEIAHIANGDMVSMSVTRSTVRAFTFIVQIPLSIITFFMAQKNEKGERSEFLILICLAVQWLTLHICNFMGNILMNFFSRKREYAADKLASRIMDKESMISALSKLESNLTLNLPKPTKEQMALAAFKISTTSSFMEIFSTHPTIEKRIEKLKE